MPIANQIIPTPPTVPQPQQGGLNSQTQQHRSAIQTPWGIRISQTQSAQAMGNGSYVTAGFDTLVFNTYQALAGNNYNLKFGNLSFGGNNYPYSFIYVPQYGYYQVEALLTLDASSIGLENILLQGIIIQAGNTVVERVNGFVAVATLEQQSLVFGDILQCNPGDEIYFRFREANTGPSAGQTYSDSAHFFANIRYLGVS